MRPRLLLYPDHSQEKVQRTYNWVMSQDTKAGSPVPATEASQAAAGHHQPGQTLRPGHRREREREKEPETSTVSCLDVSLPGLGVNRNFSNSLLGKHFTLPTSAISSVLDNVWSDKGELDARDLVSRYLDLFYYLQERILLIPPGQRR